MTKNRVAVLVVLVLSSGIFLFLTYGLIVRMSVLFFARESVAEVIEWTQKDGKTYVVYEYLNQVDSHKYKIEKEVKKTSVAELKNRQELAIRYSTLFPNFTLIDGMSDYSYILFFIGCGVAFFAAYRSVRTLRGNVPLSEFT